MIWVPGSGYNRTIVASNNPIEDDNYGYAVHIYPGYWEWITITRQHLDLIGTDIKPVADIAPIAITEIDWGSEQYLVW